MQLKRVEFGIVDNDIDTFVPKAFFATLTNVNFDDERLIDYAYQAQTYRDQLKAAYIAACKGQGVEPEMVSGQGELLLATSKPEILAQAPIALL